ncbi:exoglucanase repeat family protein [Vanderwaltozyma polyspora DSM 70294]|uniref:Exoglucanase repeat family protein n=1 Tax=Vanderwaltozyma polyspora (strain ATCC 22028 / DSM 70294 / BCRC 21397 / CBS 2163 / NBRC 10782 / NRRL Y-8283 / UCD 57-17) TaxID=436907 RepID=A7TQZ6_VANPO|nr:exoglucanase repeat family protein [Vanderwaltozyma polyspora DSM 70294]EDO15299.1 exoglucanase repeat family protein [Vanderwaltozyma polyspora DSM 70294]
MLGTNIFVLLSVLFNLTLSFNIDANVLGKDEDIAVDPEYRGQYKGINIGGWLVTEPYITPSLYENAMDLAKKKGSNVTIINEYTLCEALGYDDAKELLDNHFKSWITEEDFKKISEEGFNYVKIPIGYWAWKIDNETNLYPGNQTFSDPYVNSNQKEYLDKAIDWALKYDLKVLVNVYAVHNSTNYIDDFDSDSYYFWKYENATEVISVILKDYYDYMLNIDYPSSLVGLEVSFTPIDGIFFGQNDLIDFYTDLFDYYESAKESIKSPNPNITFILEQNGPTYNMTYHDLDRDFYNSSSPYYKGVGYRSDARLAEADDSYFLYAYSKDIFDQYNGTDEYLDVLYNYQRNLTGEPDFPITFVGSWSGALTDCTPWINGIGYGSDYDNTYDEGDNDHYSDYNEGYTCVSQKPIDQWPEEYKVQVRKFIEVQLSRFNTYNKGWFFWNWKTESAPEWDYQKLRDHNLFPHPFDNFTYYNTNGDLNLAGSDNNSSPSSTKTSLNTSLSVRSSVVSSYKATTSKTTSKTDSSSISMYGGKTSSTSSTSSTNSNSTAASHKNGTCAIKSFSILTSIFSWSLTLISLTCGIALFV